MISSYNKEKIVVIQSLKYHIFLHNFMQVTTIQFRKIIFVTIKF